MTYPRVCINLAKLKENVDMLAALCHQNGISMAAVSKCLCAKPEVVKMLDESNADMIADSRILNLAGMECEKERMLIRIPTPSEAEFVPAHSELSLCSEIAVIERVGQAAELLRKTHKLILMIDMGDLREGIFFENEPLIYKTAEAILRQRNLVLQGVGVNLSCFGGILPDDKNLTGLVQVAQRLQDRYSIELPMVSGGNSSTMNMLLGGAVPKGINNLRIGEAYLLANDTSNCQRIPGYHFDCFKLFAELAEVQDKPSKPIGLSGANAFGERVDFPDRGPMRRGILALGRQDVIPDGLTPLDPRLEILGASSDHTLINLTAAPEYKVGDIVEFDVDYGALLRLFTGEYVIKEYHT